MKFKLGFSIFMAHFLVVFSEKIRYDDYRVLSVNIANEQQLKVLLNFEKSRDGVSFFEMPNAADQTADLVIPPHELADIKGLLRTHGIKNRIKIENLQKFASKSNLIAIQSD